MVYIFTLFLQHLFSSGKTSDFFFGFDVFLFFSQKSILFIHPTKYCVKSYSFTEVENPVNLSGIYFFLPACHNIACPLYWGGATEAVPSRHVHVGGNNHAATASAADFRWRIRQLVLLPPRKSGNHRHQLADYEVYPVHLQDVVSEMIG